MREINEIIIHCTATYYTRNVSVAEVEQWHKVRGFDTIGYHYLVHQDGQIDVGRPLAMVGAHCKGHNAASIGICYVGGIGWDSKPADTRTPQQKEALRILIKVLLAVFPIKSIVGHNAYASKACPCFDVKAEYQDLL